MLAVYSARRETAAYYVVMPDAVWLAWDWNAVGGPPHEFQEEGFRWERVTNED